MPGNPKEIGSKEKQGFKIYKVCDSKEWNRIVFVGQIHEVLLEKNKKIYRAKLTVKVVRRYH